MDKLSYKIKVLVLIGVATLTGMSSCNNYLDVVPDDGLATIETAFNLRSTAIRYLGTCYSYMTGEGASGSDPAFWEGMNSGILSAGQSVTKLPVYRLPCFRSQGVCRVQARFIPTTGPPCTRVSVAVTF